MKILVIGRFYEEGVALFIAEELARMGHAVARFDPGPKLAPFGGKAAFYLNRVRSLAADAVQKLRLMAGRDLFGARLARVLEAAGGTDLVLVTHDYLTPADAEALKAATRAPLVLWFPDPVWSFRRHMFLNAPYDMLFFKDPYLVHMIGSKLGKRVFYMPECYAPGSLAPGADGPQGDGPQGDAPEAAGAETDGALRNGAGEDALGTDGPGGASDPSGQGAGAVKSAGPRARAGDADARSTAPAANGTGGAAPTGAALGEAGAGAGRGAAVFGPAEDGYAADLCIAGNLYAYRVALFERLAEYDLKIWGLPAPPWMRTEGLGDAVQNRFVAHGEKARAFRGAKIVLNTLNPAEIWGTNVRTFEACGAGAFQIVDWRPGLGQLFEIGREVEVFTDLDDLHGKIGRYLPDPEARAAIAAAGQARARRDHTYRIRLGQLLESVAGARAGYPMPEPAWQAPGAAEPGAGAMPLRRRA